MYSWTAMQTFARCNRAFELGYRENIELIPNETNEARLTGMVLHAGMAANLLTQREPLDERIKIAIKAAERALEQETIPNKLIRGLDGNQVIDTFYYLMLEGIHQQIPRLLEYIIPQFDLERYYVPLAGELLPKGDWCKCDICSGSGKVRHGQTTCNRCYGLGTDKSYGRECSCVIEDECQNCDSTGFAESKMRQPMVEWKFEFEDFTGIIDAVLYDRETGEFIMVDWKFRSKFVADEIAAMDGQLPFYAACLNAMGAKISQTVMYQVRRAVPKPAVINQNKMPSIAAQDTTWSYWLETLPSDLRDKLDLGEWQVKLEHKLKSETDYINPIAMIVTDKSSEIALNNARMIVAMMEVANRMYDDGYAMPATLNDTACKWCDFKMLCRAGLKYGGDTQQLIEDEFQQRRGRQEYDTN